MSKRDDLLEFLKKKKISKQVAVGILIQEIDKEQLGVYWKPKEKAVLEPEETR